jgi:hypothetical protein
LNENIHFYFAYCWEEIYNHYLVVAKHRNPNVNIYVNYKNGPKGLLKLGVGVGCLRGMNKPLKLYLLMGRSPRRPSLGWNKLSRLEAARRAFSLSGWVLVGGTAMWLVTASSAQDPVTLPVNTSTSSVTSPSAGSFDTFPKTLRAKVQSLNPTRRSVLLARPDGQLIEITVPDTIPVYSKAKTPLQYSDLHPPMQLKVVYYPLTLEAIQITQQ